MHCKRGGALSLIRTSTEGGCEPMYSTCADMGEGGSKISKKTAGVLCKCPLTYLKLIATLHITRFALSLSTFSNFSFSCFFKFQFSFFPLTSPLVLKLPINIVSRGDVRLVKVYAIAFIAVSKFHSN